jgi:DNA-binding LacI/PurR family transcriptional regulator
MPTAIDPSSTTGTVYRQVLRHIRQHRLGQGDRLPPQSQWLRTLNCGTVPFNSAMRLLETHGVLERRPTGTTLLRPAPKRPIQWSVGVCMPRLPTLSASYPALLQYLLLHLQKDGCQARLYHFNSPARITDYSRLSDFENLSPDVKAGTLDGLMSIPRLAPGERRRLREQGVTDCQLMELDPRGQGVVIDLPTMIQDSVCLLRGRGCHRIAAVGGINHTWREVAGGTLWEAFTQAVAPLPPLEFYEYGCASAGQIVARRLLDMPPQERPDALVCFWDEYFILGMTEALEQDVSYRPAIATLTNRQSPLPFFLPVYRYEIDLNEVAQKGVKLLMDQLSSPQEAPDRIRVVPRLNETPAAKLSDRMLEPPERRMIPTEGMRRTITALHEADASFSPPSRKKERCHES